MDAASTPVEVGVGERVRLQVGEQRATAQVDPHPAEPGLEQAAGVVGADVGGDLALAGVALADHPFRHPQHRPRVGPLRTHFVPHTGGNYVRTVAVAVAEDKRTRGQRHRRVRPLGGTALFAAGVGVAAANLLQKLFRRPRGRHLGVGAADVDAGMVVGAADPGTAPRVDVEGGRHVQLRGPRPVADLPDREQLGEAAAMALGQRRRHVEEGVREGAGDPVLVQVCGAGLDVAGMCLQPLVVSGGDPVTKDVNRLGLAGEAGGQLLGDEAVGPALELEAARDRVVVGDRDEVHPPPFRQLVDLLRRGRALGQAERALDAQPRELGGAGMAVHIDAGSHRCLPYGRSLIWDFPYLGSLCRPQIRQIAGETCEAAANEV